MVSMQGFMSGVLSREPYSASRNFIISATFWLVVGTLMGLIASLQFSVPDALAGVPQLSFGRLRPVHVNAILIGWLSMAYVGSYYYILPTLSRRNGLWSERLGNVVMVLWNVALLVGMFTLVNGDSEGREYAELAGTLHIGGMTIQVLDWAILSVIVLTGINCWMTVNTGEEKKWYVSVWYMLGLLLLVPLFST